MAHQMSGSAPVNLTGAAILLVILAGCLDSSDAGLAGPAPLLELVKAKYVLADGKSFQMSLTEPVRILDRDGEHRLAYPLVEKHDSFPDQPIIYYLDDSLHVVRVDSPCINKVQGVCQYHHVNWQFQGVLPPLGAGLLWHLQGGAAVSYSVWNEAHVTVPSVVRSNGQVRVTIADYSSRVPSNTSGLLSANGFYAFDEGDLLPSSFAVGAGSDRRVGARLSHERLGPLPPAEGWPRIATPPSPRPREGRMFPGEVRDDFGLGVPHLEALEWLLNTSAKAREMLDGGGCVVGFTAAPKEDPPATNDLLKQDSIRFRIEIVDVVGRATMWQFHRDTSVLETKYAMDDEDAIRWKAGCVEVRRSPQPIVSSTEFFGTSTRVLVSHTGRVSFTFGVAPSSAPVWLPENGWDQYLRQYRPAFVDPAEAVVTYSPYTIMMNANQGWWAWWSVHSDDVKKMDAA